VTSSTFLDLLSRSFLLLEREAPRCARALCGVLRETTLAVEIDDERLLVRVTGDRLVAVSTTGQHDVTLRTSRGTLRAMLRGELALLEATLADDLELHGSLDELLAVYDCLKLYLHGAVRSPGFPALFEELMSRNEAAFADSRLHSERPS
jgi:hypothetical protein